jgi:hypothetical protein
VCLCALLGFLVFFLDKEDLGDRLGIVVTLFLALTAVQFVLSETQPSASYVRGRSRGGFREGGGCVGCWKKVACRMGK